MNATMRWLRLTGVLLLTAAAQGCSAENPDDGLFVSRFNVNLPERAWVPVAQADTTPQQTPAMVIYEVSKFREDTPTPEQQADAKALLDASFLSATQRGWYEYERGIADGYHLIFGDEVHYVNEDYLFDGVVLDPERPEFLMYYDSPRGKVLVGYMFYVDAEFAHGPQVGGARTTWHYHVWSQARCFVRGLLAVSLVDEDGGCDRGSASHRSPEMLHVWLVDHPQGPFATRMRIPPRILARLIEERGY